MHVIQGVIVRTAQVDTSKLRAQDWELLRTGIALKTFTALIKKYQNMDEEASERKLKEAKMFAKVCGGIFRRCSRMRLSG